MSEPNMNNENNDMNMYTDAGLNNTNGGADHVGGAGVEGADVVGAGGVGAGGVGADVEGAGGVGAQEMDNVNTERHDREEARGSNESPPRKKKRYNRHSQFQIKGMETFYKECPHPDEKQRRDLAYQLDLTPAQIKFWFQNKRTQIKNHQERIENTELRKSNNNLRDQNIGLREAVLIAVCPKCGGPTAIGDMCFEEHHLRNQNARLQEEINQLSALASSFANKQVTMTKAISPPTPLPPLPSLPSLPPLPPHRPFEFEAGSSSSTTQRDLYGSDGNLSMEIITGPAEADKPMIIELAVRAMNELMLMAQVAEPLWTGGVNGTSLHLDLDEYTRMFQKGLGPKVSGYRTEASRVTGLVPMIPINIVEMLMDSDMWSTMFVGMINRAITHEQIPTDVSGSYNGVLQIMSAEYQVFSPLVSTRQSYFARYCKQQGDNLWAVVDFSIDHFLPNIHLRCRRRPSGCLIQEIPNGYSKVTWVENVEVDDRDAEQNMFKHFIRSGQAFAANRWVATMERQCERIASIITTEIQSVDSADHLVLTDHGKKSILQLVERIARGFFIGLKNSMGTTFSGVAGDDIRVMTMKNMDDPGRPPGSVLAAASSFWVPVPPKTVFDFLRNEQNRPQWDVLFTGGNAQKIVEIANGRDSRNCASLLRNANTFQNNMMVIQETTTDPTASFVIYAPVETEAIEAVLNGGGDPDAVALLPCGFAILPDGTVQPGGNAGGSLLTVAYQMLLETVPTDKLSVSSVATVENLIRSTVMNIKELFPYQNP